MSGVQRYNTCVRCDATPVSGIQRYNNCVQCPKIQHLCRVSKDTTPDAGPTLVSDVQRYTTCVRCPKIHHLCQVSKDTPPMSGVQRDTTCVRCPKTQHLCQVSKDTTPMSGVQRHNTELTANPVSRTLQTDRCPHISKWIRLVFITNKNKANPPHRNAYVYINILQVIMTHDIKFHYVL